MNRHRPHNVEPSKETVRCVIAYKNFAASKGISHIGLGVTASTNAAALKAEGYWVEVWPIVSCKELVARLDKTREEALTRGITPVSHVVISAPWIPTLELQSMVYSNTDIEFAVVSHSNIGFLQADPNGIKLLREASDMSVGAHNLDVAANNSKLARWWESAYGRRMIQLPNIYPFIHGLVQYGEWKRKCPLRIGLFGATRPSKNLVTSVAAAIDIAVRLQVDAEIWVSAKRVEGGSGTVINAAEALCHNVPNVHIRFSDWQPWANFRQTVRSMDLLIQMSYTESFNMVTADGVAEGVCSVTSPSIDWVPDSWKANPDDASEIADVGIGLLHDPTAAIYGTRALDRHNESAVRSWERYFFGRAR